MAYTNNSSDRMDEMRFRNQHSPRNEASMLSGLVSPPRNGNRMPQQQGLTRRFTTDSGRVPTISSLTTPRTGGSGAREEEYGPSTYHKVQLVRSFPFNNPLPNQPSRPPHFTKPMHTTQEHTPSGEIAKHKAVESGLPQHSDLQILQLEKKKLEYERLREQKRRFEAEMQLLDLQQRKEEQELAQMQEDLGRNNSNNAGHQSEPTTPPEYRDTNSGFPSVFSRPNRYSTSSLTSPPGIYNRPGRSGSQLTSPQSGIIQSRFIMDDKIPSKSVPGSRRNSDEDEKEEAVRQDPTSHRSTNALNRYSMPVTKSRNGMHEMLALDQTNTARFLFGEEEGGGSTTPDVKNYLQMNATDDKFPILVRREEYPGVLSASSAALDLATSQSPGPDSHANGWGSSFARHRPSQSQASMPLTLTNGSSSQANGSDSPISVRPSYRHSLDLKSFDGQESFAPVASPPKHVQATPPKLQSSYSANDVPTMRTATNGASSVNQTPNSHAQQHLHNHNASLGRIPPNAMNNRISREMSAGDAATLREAQNGSYQSIQSALQANAPQFAPSVSQGVSQNTSTAAMTSPTVSNQYGTPGGYYNNYNMQLMTMGMQNMGIGQPMYSPHNPYVNYGGGMYPQAGGTRDSQARVIQQRRQNDGEAMNRFANMPLEQLGGEIYALCKDQHGCRYLQKKLEDRNPDQVHMIWLETNQHVIELMTDPFGNYLCQKLLEYCNDDERTVLIENASHDMVRIALNQHGTRALQKMIEYISTAGQIQTIISALRYRVVELIQDLNGNHVIQKCLNKLTATDAQFIFDAVGNHCVEVGTHRHGCCVLQRCIDHAVGEQKAWLIRQISNNAYILVQDPFGNYVVQYILDLGEPVFTEPLVGMFQGRVGQLSKQKFSSNVIEKCLRCAQEPSKDMLIEEMLQPTELDRLLRDSFANYVIQTALDYANPAMKNRLIDAIRPHLPAIRTTPYGRRIQAKIQGNEGRSGPSSGQQTPNEAVEPVQTPVRHARGSSNVAAGTYVPPVHAYANGVYVQGNGPANGLSLPANRPAALSNGNYPSNQVLNTTPTQQSFPYTYGRGAAPSGSANWL